MDAVYEAVRSHAQTMEQLGADLLTLLRGDPHNPDLLVLARNLEQHADITLQALERHKAWLEGWQAAKQHYGIR